MELKLIKKAYGEYYVDENNNEWNALLYSWEDATKASNSLIGCENCSNCRTCSYCTNCWDCECCENCNDCSDCAYCCGCDDCRDCSTCSYCKICLDCDHCQNCEGCHHCSNCSASNNCYECFSCTGCDDCHNCLDCRRCKSFDKNPQRIVGCHMGSYNDTPAIYWIYPGAEQCVLGSFHGNLNELEEKVKETYKDNQKHLNDCLQWIEKVRKYMEV